MPAVDIFDRYLSALRKIAVEDKTEHTDRGALEALLSALAGDIDANIHVQHEPKRDALKGAPDFKVASKGLILGYVETKKLNDNLDKILKSEQIAKYRTLSGNIILTDYLHFIWISEAGVQRESLCHASDLENRKFRLRPEKVEAVRKLLRGFFFTAPQGVGRASQLAIALATRARLLRDSLFEELTRQQKEHEEGRLFGLYQVFQKQVFQELTLKEFADAFAQMLAYGLFLARLNSELAPVTLRNARDFVPASFQLIRELVDFLSELDKQEYAGVRWVVEEVLSIVNGLDLLAIHEDLSFRHRKATSRKVKARDEEEHRLFERDPFIYFYEDFLNHYDKETRKARGVYYTPPPVVSFIVRAVDDILKDTFAIKAGLADHQRVTVLDFACGTGTFLLEVFQRIFDNIGGANAGHADLIVREHLLKNIYGFEYLIAPYTIAHLKLSQYLREQQLPLRDGERLKVFLTNTLEPIEPQKNFLLPAITAEAEAAQAVKEKPVLVIVGNPPYSGHSKNKGAWITSAINGYKYTIETDANGLEQKKPLGERNPKWLNDDYVKFLRFAQMKMDQVEEGVVGVITNHSWLDNPTFRGMRQSLMRSFEQIYVLDLHGNAKKKEQAPDGSKDENVFDIEQGVAITIFVKRKGLERGLWHADLWGSRISKYKASMVTDLKHSDFRKLNPFAGNYVFQIENESSRSEYDEGKKLNEIFVINSVGIVAGRDSLCIQFSKKELMESLRRFVSLSTEDAREEFSLGSDSSDWKIASAQEDVSSSGLNQKLAKLILHQPFDSRWTYYTGNSSGFHVRPRPNTMGHMFSQKNIAINLIRKKDISGGWSHILASDHPITHHAVSNKEVNYLFPLHEMHGASAAKENLSPDFRAFLDARYAHHYAPEEVLGYLYAVLHAPSYRSRYADFLRIDFPRIPFAQERQHFDALSALGWALVQAHLLRDCPHRGLAQYAGKGDHSVESVVWGEADQRIHINKTQSFGPVPEKVWRFTIGGYQVLDKYLKSRKGRRLSLDEINHLGQVADSLAFTIDQMALIDKAWAQAFPDRG